MVETIYLLQRLVISLKLNFLLFSQQRSKNRLFFLFAVISDKIVELTKVW